MTNLLDKLTATTGPDRALDAEIENLLAGGSDADLAYILENIEGATRPPHYTGSIDAALTLMPPNHIQRISQIHFGMWRVEVWRGDVSFHEPSLVDLAHMTEPLARTVAALHCRPASPP